VLLVNPDPLPAKPGLCDREGPALCQFGNLVSKREWDSGAPEECFGLCCHR
jgi:hypothetical protein